MPLAKICLCALAAFVLSGCMHGDRPYAPVQLAPNESAIYLYRPRSVLSPGHVRVLVNQTELAALRRNTHIAVVVPPGEHLVRVERRSDATRRVLIGRGESVYYEVGAALFGGKVSLENPGRDLAMRRIAETRAIAEPVRLDPTTD